jgi:RNA polymerase sigma-70 factor (ECF subfamily)
VDDPALAEAHTRGAAAWPSVRVDLVDFARFVHERAADLARAEDLYLACACARGDGAALKAFDAAFGPDIAAAYGRFRYVGKTADDVKQLLFEKLFAHDRPKIAEYSGKGELRMWLKVTITRMLINFSARDTRELPAADDLFCALPGAAADPELAHLRRTYAAELKEAFGRAVTKLSARERNLLHYACVEDLGIDAIGELYGVHRATAARWLQDARAALFKHLRAALLAQLRVRPDELESIVRMMLSRVEITLERYLP